LVVVFGIRVGWFLLGLFTILRSIFAFLGKSGILTGVGIIVGSFLFISLTLEFFDSSLNGGFVVGSNVLGDNAEEVSEEAVGNEGNVSREDNFLLSGGMGESNTVVSSNNIIVLVEEPEVDCVPDGTE